MAEPPGVVEGFIHARFRGNPSTYAGASGEWPDAVLLRLGDADIRQDPEAEGRRALPSAALVGTAQQSADNFATVDIATPHGGVLAMLALAVSESVTAGEVVARVRASSAGPWEAFGFVTREEALRLAPGMQAQVRLAVPGTGTRQVLAARVEDVSPRVVTPLHG